uniref:Uncharacterized protein n=1 Tax=Anguilla anguilla TaxID=7936 RepID=A0A0E9VCX1_ANGAN
MKRRVSPAVISTKAVLMGLGRQVFSHSHTYSTLIEYL